MLLYLYTSKDFLSILHAFFSALSNKLLILIYDWIVHVLQTLLITVCIFFLVSAISVGPCTPDPSCLWLGLVQSVVLLAVVGFACSAMHRVSTSTAVLVLLLVPARGLVPGHRWLLVVVFIAVVFCLYVVGSLLVVLLLVCYLLFVLADAWVL